MTQQGETLETIRELDRLALTKGKGKSGGKSKAERAQIPAYNKSVVKQQSGSGGSGTTPTRHHPQLKRVLETHPLTAGSWASQQSPWSESWGSDAGGDPAQSQAKSSRKGGQSSGQQPSGSGSWQQQNWSGWEETGSGRGWSSR